MKQILCFGDSNTFGYIPGGIGRYDRRTRWPGRLQRLLGDGFRVIEEGVCGRTTAFPDPYEPGKCGLDDICADMELYGPVDLLIVMLGTNDCKNYFSLSAGQITEGLKKVLDQALAASYPPGKLLVIAPAPLDEAVLSHAFGAEFDETSIAVSRELATEYGVLAKAYGADFLDASKVTSVSKEDGVHLDAGGHEKLAQAVTSWVRK